MVQPLTWVLVGLLVYTVVAMGLKARGLLPDSVRVSGPITTLHTKRGREFLNRLASPKRFWRAYANVGVGVGLVVMAMSFLLILFSGLASLEAEPTAANQPRNVLVIPGVNEFIPLSVTPYVVVGLAVGLIVHEGGHGLLCRVEDIDIESMGLAFLTVIPVGAFVEPDEESRAAADRGAQVRMFTAGVTNNFAIGALAILLLFGPVAGSVAVADGYPVGGTMAGGPSGDDGIVDGGTDTVDETTDTVDETTGGATDETTDTVDETVDDTTDTVDETVEDGTDTIDETVEGITDGTTTSSTNTSPAASRRATSSRRSAGPPSRGPRTGARRSRKPTPGISPSVSRTDAR